MTRQSIKVATLFIINVMIWTYAGYAIGNAKGRGWRGAMIEGDGGCSVVCKL
jgi:hypothetical protein